MRASTVCGDTRSPSLKRTSLTAPSTSAVTCTSSCGSERAQGLDLVGDVLDGHGRHAHGESGAATRAAAPGGLALGAGCSRATKGQAREGEKGSADRSLGAPQRFRIGTDSEPLLCAPGAAGRPSQRGASKLSNRCRSPAIAVRIGLGGSHRCTIPAFPRRSKAGAFFTRCSACAGRPGGLSPERRSTRTRRSRRGDPRRDGPGRARAPPPSTTLLGHKGDLMLVHFRRGLRGPPGRAARGRALAPGPLPRAHDLLRVRGGARDVRDDRADPRAPGREGPEDGLARVREGLRRRDGGAAQARDGPPLPGGAGRGDTCASTR